MKQGFEDQHFMRCHEGQCSLDVRLPDWRWLIDVVLVPKAKRRFDTERKGTPGY